MSDIKIGDYVRFDYSGTDYSERDKEIYNHTGEVVGRVPDSALWTINRLHGTMAGQTWTCTNESLIKIGHPDKIEVGDTISCVRWADYSNSVVLTLDSTKADEHGDRLTAQRPDGTVWAGSTGFNHIVRKWDDNGPLIQDTNNERSTTVSVTVPTPEFSAELVVEKVFAYSGCDEGKYDWLATVGLDREVVDALRFKRRPFKKGDIVKCVVGGISQLTVNRLYYVQKDESPYLSNGNEAPDGKPRLKILSDDQIVSRYREEYFELVQAVDA